MLLDILLPLGFPLSCIYLAWLWCYIFIAAPPQEADMEAMWLFLSAEGKTSYSSVLIPRRKVLLPLMSCYHKFGLQLHKNIKNSYTSFLWARKAHFFLLQNWMRNVENSKNRSQWLFCLCFFVSIQLKISLELCFLGCFSFFPKR